MNDTDKYEGHIQGEWRDTIHEGALAHHIVAYNPQIAYANDAGNVNICTVFPNEATANLVADAPLLLAEVKRLTEFRDRVLVAFHEMPRNGRSLTYLLDELGYLNHYSRADYLEGLHPHALGLYELMDEWMEKAKQYLGDDEE